MAAGETDYLVNFHSRQICPVVYDYCSRTVVTRADRHPGDSFSGYGQKLYYPASRSISEVFMLADEACRDRGHPRNRMLLYATYWFRPILSELIGAATESATVNRDRAPSGPVKVVVTNQPHSRPNAGIDLASGVSALLAWFPASWASKVAPCFIGEAGGAAQLPQEVMIQCSTREAANTQRDDRDQVLQAVKFTDKKVPGLHLDLDEDLQAAGCFTEAIRGYQMGVVEPDVMHGLQPAGATRVTLDVIIPSPTGLTPEKWKQTATLCPLDWPSNYSLLRLWHVPKDLHQFVDQLNQQMNHRHMFSSWEINYDKFTSRVLYQLPAHYAPEATLRQHVQTRDFPSRRVRKRPPQGDVAEFKAKCTELRRLATIQEAANPVSFALENSWTATLKSDKHHYLEHIIYSPHDLVFPPACCVLARYGPILALVSFVFVSLCAFCYCGVCLSADWTGAPPSPPPSPKFVSTFFSSTFATFATLMF